jgi:hypothetical protein
MSSCSLFEEGDGLGLAASDGVAENSIPNTIASAPSQSENPRLLSSVRWFKPASVIPFTRTSRRCSSVERDYSKSLTFHGTCINLLALYYDPITKANKKVELQND